MAVGDDFEISKVIPTNDSVAINASNTDTGAVEIKTIGADGSVDVFIEKDTNGNGTYDREMLIDSKQGQFYSQSNMITINSDDNRQLRVDNTDSKEIKVFGNGIEIAN